MKLNAPILILLISMVLSSRRRKAGNTENGLPLLELIMAATIGLVLTLFAAWFVHNQETRSHQETFRQLAEDKGAALMEYFHNLGNRNILIYHFRFDCYII